ncbi:FHA domain-containing protein [Cellulomonas sp. PhB143]|uniref:FHA domain-containing protein n=1 Tax=Cellulomonas sp. PhB143 TaxID=2485186 RepID=UPI000F4A183D|nr:FHA domain-containing protein [Cellulomonas sp. PhB143]ROS77033.1 pSer/pThr/pTyr-binding forkhead associated (FHA) protein [Cellulomonas sp. PhB143]
MSAVRCPAGHVSASTDYCDTCGAPIAPGTPAGPGGPEASAPPPAVGSAPTGGPTTTCPSCAAPAATGALFCERCGYDFTTGTAPEPFAGTGVEAGETPERGDGPREPEPEADPGSRSRPPRAAGGARPGETGLLRSAGSGRISTPTHAPESTSPAAPSPPAAEPWVVEVWVDPEWYADQQAPDPLPSGAPPGLVVLRERSVLVGRASASRHIHPQVDCGSDTAVSRRHCQLNTDGRRWWVEDLESSNGTFVGRPGESLPQEPLVPGRRQELGDGDRVYVGAWTRLVVRRALPGEI